MPNILVLGITGMLGSMVYDYLSQNERFNVYGTLRQRISRFENEQVFEFDADTSIDKTLEEIIEKVNPQYIINCIGVIKPYCRDNDPAGIYRAIKVNAGFPYSLQKITSMTGRGIRIIQIATDCVYDGLNGNYTETDLHNPTDVYGKTKSLGEVPEPDFLNIRCSIIGPEIKNRVSLLEWFLSHDDGQQVQGFRHHKWNGVTTLQFAQLLEEIVQQDSFNAWRKKNHVIHYVVNQTVSKYELLKLFDKVFGRKITIEPTNVTGQPVDRSIRSVYYHPPLQSMEKALTALYHYMQKSSLYHV